MDVVRFVEANPGRFDTSKIVIGGWSAGGYTALGAAIGLGLEVGRDATSSEHPIKALLAFYPVVDMSEPMNPSTTLVTYATKRNPKLSRHYPDGRPPKHPGTPIWPFVNKLMTDAYFLRSFIKPPFSSSTSHSEADRLELLAQPLMAPITAFPPVVALFTCEFDTLAETGEKLRDKLEAAGSNIQVRGRYVGNVGHGWDKRVSRDGELGWDERDQAYEECVQVLKEVYS